ncbi:MAG: oligosaccharide flippase family protein, partial [Acidobacteriota bacterium]
MSYARRFLANYTVLAIGDIGSRLISFWALVRIAHVVGTDLFGNLAFATAFTTYFALLIQQGLDTYGIQQVAREPSTMLRSAQAILGLRLAGCLLAALVLGLSLWTLDQPGQLKLLILLSGLSFLPAALSLHWAYQAMEEMKYGA